MKDLLWLVPLFPLAGFLVNGIVYLVSNRTEGVAVHPPADQPEAESSPEPGHPHAHVHLEAEPRFKTLHTAVGVGSVALSTLFAFGAIFDVGAGALAAGAHHVITLYRWIPLGVNERRVGPRGVASGFVDAAVRLDSLTALMIAFVTFGGSSSTSPSETGARAVTPVLSRTSNGYVSMLVLVLAATPADVRGWEGVGPMLVPAVG